MPYFSRNPPRDTRWSSTKMNKEPRTSPLMAPGFWHWNPNINYVKPHWNTLRTVSDMKTHTHAYTHIHTVIPIFCLDAETPMSSHNKPRSKLKSWLAAISFHIPQHKGVFAIITISADTVDNVRLCLQHQIPTRPERKQLVPSRKGSAARQEFFSSHPQWNNDWSSESQRLRGAQGHLIETVQKVNCDHES